MHRRPLVATVVTTVAGAFLGAVLGALVGRVIAFFGDETVQVSVPMVFCGTLGYFVGGASAAKGSLDRFGARRSGLGAFAAVVLLVVIIGGASVSHTAGLVIFVLGIVAAALAGAGATFVAGPQPAPVLRGGVPRAVAPPKESEAAPEEQVEAEYLADSGTSRAAVATRPAIRKVQVVHAQAEREPEPAAERDTNWTLPEAAAPARPRRDRPLRRDDAATAKPAPAPKAQAPKRQAAKAQAPKITPPPAPRQRPRGKDTK
ncbi:MAG: hypothetical protein QOG90_2489 [Actinomycetota bacterium]|jgi:hypothetical protein